MEDTWTMEEAQNNFAAIAQAAYAGQPQYIKVDARPDLVISIQPTHEITEQLDNKDNKNFVEFLLSIPKGEPFFDEKERHELNLRDIDF